MKFPKSRFIAAAAAALLAQMATAAVSPEEAKQLGGDKLTVFGAEKAGNKEGTIPAYSGKAPKAPASYNHKDPGQRPDAYNDKPLFSINAQNAGQYADKLDAWVDVFKKYPDFRMDVYPSRRDVAYPKYVLDNTLKNATSCKAVDNELKLEGCYGGMPFPIPKTGNQVMWNHLIQYVAHAYITKSSSYITPPDGKAVLQGTTEGIQQYDYFDAKRTTPNPSDVLYWQYRQNSLAPARQVGEGLVILDSLDMAGKGRRAYQYIPGQRRVKLAPNLAYDTPSPQSGGASTMDDAKAFMGALDRFDFKLIGKKEKYIPYDTFGVASDKVCSTEKFVNHAHFPNPDCVRWELHRVWVVEATLKPGYRHVYQKRRFYWDEDVPGAGTAENFDAGGKLYRLVAQLTYPGYEGDGISVMPDTGFQLDMQTGMWFVQGVHNAPGQGFSTTTPHDTRYFSPDALAAQGLR